MKKSMYWRYAGLSGVVLLLMISYTVYWFRLASEIEHGIEAWAAARRAEGMAIEYSAAQVTGFPLRVQPQVTRLRIAAPGQPPAWQWRSELLVANVLPYNINHIVFSAPQPQDISVRINHGEMEHYRIVPGRVRASLSLAQGKPVRLDIDLEGGALSGGRLQAGPVNLGRVQAHLRDAVSREPEQEMSPLGPPLFDIAIKLEDISYPGFANSALGAKLRSFAMDASVMGEWPVLQGVAGVRQWRDAGGVAQIAKLDIKWGPLDLTAGGTVALDAQDRLIGSLTARLTGYDDLIKGLQNAGQLKQDEAEAARVGLGIIAIAAGGKRGELSLPLALQDGEMFLGPLRLARLRPLF